jgi:hypothetical protein
MHRQDLLLIEVPGLTLDNRAKAEHKESEKQLVREMFF